MRENMKSKKATSPLGIAIFMLISVSLIIAYRVAMKSMTGTATIGKIDKSVQLSCQTILNNILSGDYSRRGTTGFVLSDDLNYNNLLEFYNISIDENGEIEGSSLPWEDSLDIIRLMPAFNEKADFYICLADECLEAQDFIDKYSANRRNLNVYGTATNCRVELFSPYLRNQEKQAIILYIIDKGEEVS